MTSGATQPSRWRRVKPHDRVTMPLELNDKPVTPIDRAGDRITAADAVDIWILRWLNVRRKDILARYGCDPRRLYEIWWEERFVGSRKRAIEAFRERYPELADRVDYGPYKRIARTVDEDRQLSLFE
jgi:hypothetical protein